MTELVEPLVAELYLSAHGWDEKRRAESFSTWSRSLDGRLSHLFLPLSREPADYPERLYDFVQKLADAEGRDPEVVLTNLRYAKADLVRLRLEGPRVKTGEVPIEEGAPLFQGARSLMLAAACAAVEAKASYGSRKPKTATNYMENVRLGQTEAGSYVVTVISELAVSQQETLFQDQAVPPFERRVTETLADALGAAKQAASDVQSGSEISVFLQAVERGVSANLCDAIVLAAAEDDGAGVEVMVDWSPAWAIPITPEGQPLPKVRFEPSDVRIVREGGSFLKQLGPFEDQEVDGFVTHLDRGTDETVGTVVISARVVGQSRNIHVELGGDEYHLAVQAHDERRRVALRGTVVKDGRHWLLTSPGRLRLLDGWD